MSFAQVSTADGIATLVLARGKVNALNPTVVAYIRGALEELENDERVRAVVLTGQGKFFSFGFDIPEFLSYSPEAFTEFLTAFTGLYTYMFLFPKPLVAALNGHTIAGGCMLATTCDYRLMVTGKAKISLNEVTFGASVFAGSVEMLKYQVGSRNAETVLCGGAMYSAEDAARLGLVDQVASAEQLTAEAVNVAREFAAKDRVAFGSIKGLLRKPVAERMVRAEHDSIREFVEIWYSAETRKNLKEIKIHP